MTSDVSRITLERSKLFATASTAVLPPHPTMLSLPVNIQSQPGCCLKTTHIAMEFSLGLLPFFPPAQTSFTTVLDMGEAAKPKFEVLFTDAANVLKAGETFLTWNL